MSTPDDQADAFRVFGETITEIGMRPLSGDRDLNDDEIAAVAFCARNVLSWAASPAGPEALPQSERGGLDVERLASLIIEYRFDQHEESSEWGSWESLWDRLASIHGRPGDSSRREAGAMLRHLIALASPAHPDEE